MIANKCMRMKITGEIFAVRKNLSYNVKHVVIVSSVIPFHFIYQKAAVAISKRKNSQFALFSGYFVAINLTAL